VSEWTKQDQARADFVDAAIAYFRRMDESIDPGDECEADRAFETMESKWLPFRDLLDGAAENAPLDPARWFCPHCGKERPSFNFQLVGQAVFGIGALQYFNIFCGEETCRKLLSVAMVGFMPEAQVLDEARRQMRGKISMSQ
jgi:hypothetical protein